MPHLYTDEQHHIRDEVRRALSASGASARVRELLEVTGRYDAELWARARELGWTALGVSEAAGGLGLGVVEGLIVAEECGRVVAGAPYLSTAPAVIHALSVARDPHGRLAAIAAGDLRTALALAEGCEPIPARPSVRLADERLTGVKTAALGAAAADLAIVLATDAAGAPQLLSVDLDQEGVRRVPLETVDNSRCLADLHFENARAVRLVVQEPMAVARRCLGRLALFLAAEGVGGADSCIQLATDYANERQAFGQAIGKFQAVKHAIAEMYVANEMARASVLDAALRLEREDRDAEAFVAAARLNAVQAYEAAAGGATQIFGGLGVTWEADLHLHYRRARAIALEAGPPAFWEDIIVSELAA